MQYQDLISKTQCLKTILNDLKIEYVYSKTKLRIGDTVKFIKKGDYYKGEKDEKHTEKIYDFEVVSESIIYAKCGNHQNPNISDCRKVSVSYGYL
ncbi:hypothetical protein SL057_002427 [Flavobacterium psychrophilum]|nr:hypothetical protein [Flavobacterium psychrophilum]